MSKSNSIKWMNQPCQQWQAPPRGNAAMAMDDQLSSEETAQLDAQRDADNAPSEPVIATPEPVVTAPEPAAPTAPVPAQTQDIDPATGKQRTVDYGAFHSERERRKAADKRAQEAEKNLATLNGRFGILEELARSAGKPQAAPEAIPDVDTDPVGHFRAKAAEAERQLSEINRWRQSQEANATAMNNVQRLQQIAVAHENDFSQKTPDYQDAASYVRNARDQELQYMGYADPAIRMQIIQNDALQIAAQALQSNMNAAEVVYNIAKARGWAGKKAEASPPAPTPPPAPVPTADAKKIATIAKGQEANKSLGQVNGGANPPMTMDTLLAMSDEDFEKATKGNKWRQLMGGN